MSESRLLPFRRALPIAQLAVCVALLWLWRGFLVEQLQAAVPSRWPMRVSRPVIYIDTVQATLTTQKQKRAMELMELRSIAPQLLNLPCFLLGLGRPEMVPRGMLAEFWRSMTWPFFGIIFWCIAGRGIDALVASRSARLSPVVTWMEVFVASLVILLGVSICGLFLSGPNDRSGFVFPWPPAIAASILWIVLGSATVAARVVQWRIKRRDPVV
jgi:hypothetical protein